MPNSQTMRLLTLLNAVALAMILGLSTGCRLMNPREARLGPPFEPQNVYLAAPELSADLRRVVVMPMAVANESSTFSEGRQMLGSVLASELVKTRKFEVITLTHAQARSASGKEIWSGEEVLPSDFMERLGAAYACDAVFFCQMTAFRPYAPLAIGWRMKLVDARSGQILWAADETFDAGHASVRSGALRYQKSEFKTLESGEWVMENSPRHFGQYSLATLLETLPAR